MAKVGEEDKHEPAPVDEAALGPVEGEVEVPYSIYTSKEKWIIVGMVALAGFYRYVCMSRYRELLLVDPHSLVLSLQTSTSQPSPPWPAPLVKQ